MYPDFVYEWCVNRTGIHGHGWILFGVIFIILYFVVDISVIWISGGVREIRNSQSYKNLNIINYSDFVRGGKKGWKKYTTDPTALIWPFTILAIPIALFGIVHFEITDSVNILHNNQLPIMSYRHPKLISWNNNLIYFIIVLGIVFSLWNFLRHEKILPMMEKRRTKKEVNVQEPGYFFPPKDIEASEEKYNWLGLSTPHHFVHILLFNLPVNFAIVSIALIWLDYSSALSRLLNDDQIVYELLNPDMMYGLKTAYDNVVFVSAMLIILSFLPTVLLLKEKPSIFRTLMWLLIVLCVLISLVIAGFLILDFNNRLKTIHSSAMEEAMNYVQLNLSMPRRIPDTQTLIEIMQYFLLMENLPSKFEIPAILSFSLIISILLKIFELVFIVSPETKKSELSEYLVKTLKFIKE